MDAFATPKKKRLYIDEDDSVITPKKLRSAPLTPPPTTKFQRNDIKSFPSHLSRLLSLHSSIEQAISIALATSSMGLSNSSRSLSSKENSSAIPNVVNHISLQSVGMGKRLSVEDLSRLVWLWEWDGITKPESFSHNAAISRSDDDNPFLVPSAEWIRGGLGLVLTPTTHLSRTHGKRVPAYGIGIEVESSTDRKGGMASIARWTAGSEERRAALTDKLAKWTELHVCERVRERESSRASSPTPSAIPNIPFAGLPPLANITSSNMSSLTRTLLLSPPKNTSSRTPASAKQLSLPPSSIPFPTPSPSVKKPPAPARSDLLKKPPIPAPALVPRPQTPTDKQSSEIPETPTTSRRAALSERIRRKSLNTPSKGSVVIKTRDSFSGVETTRTITPEELKRRLVLGRLNSVADSVWMLFQAPSQSPSSNPTPPTRRRRAIPFNEVLSVVIKSSRTPMSTGISHGFHSSWTCWTLLPHCLPLFGSRGR
ncbi:uncharacterized protein EI90DRAFT_3058103 [Cantharellus anzutake]|uniref:uncharacterized protein n=1 Tax=Cantharellus anzutake TaxID=1750568 RepID=UPI0019062B44|nr:uncharacterized protein EI90DRAFT_3058103 [Cantharellus anzutake]KAF8331500.1 hypothetical protein EI90DRAFT_3058103 [Cantharellus anzutake]